MVSAVKVGGRRLHELARKGEEVERAPRPVRIDRLDDRGVRAGPVPRRDGRWSSAASGTYIRSLAADLGAALGGCAHLASLRRLRVGSFTLDEAHPLETIEADPDTVVLPPVDRDARPRAGRRRRRAGARGRPRRRRSRRRRSRRTRSRPARARSRWSGPTASCSRCTSARRSACGRRSCSRPSRPTDARCGSSATSPRSTASGPRRGRHDRRVRRRAPRPPRGAAARPRARRRPRPRRRRASPSTATRPRSCGPESAPKLLTTLEQKLELLDATGYLDVCCVLAFDEARSKETGRGLRARGARRGRCAPGSSSSAPTSTSATAAAATCRCSSAWAPSSASRSLGLGLVAADGATPSGEPYSSTRIRELLAAATSAAAARLLGRPHEVRGTVEIGDQRGRELGFPTANVAVPDQHLPARRRRLRRDARRRPTDDRAAGRDLARPPADVLRRRRASAARGHVLDFDGDLYGQTSRCGSCQHLRGQERFDSVDDAGRADGPRRRGDPPASSA